jgi:hypothetical protein
VAVRNCVRVCVCVCALRAHLSFWVAFRNLRNSSTLCSLRYRILCTVQGNTGVREHRTRIGGSVQEKCEAHEELERCTVRGSG